MGKGAIFPFGEGCLEHSGQSAEGQAPEDTQQGWRRGEEQQPTQAPTGHYQPSPSRDQPALPQPEQAPPAASDLVNTQAGPANPEALLLLLATTARQLASIEPAQILPPALHTFLAITGGEGGLALTPPDGAGPHQVAIRQQVSEQLATLFAHHTRLLETPPEDLLVVSTRRTRGHTGQPRPDQPGKDHRFEERLARAGVTWYLLLPLLAQRRVTAILVAVGQHEPPSALTQPAYTSAVTVLGKLASAALEQAQFRRALEHEVHARNEFIGLASHELKSPLTIIKGYAQLLLRQARRAGGNSTIDASGLEAINHQINRMSNLIGELLDASRIERGLLEIQPQPVDLVALVQHVVEQRQRTATETSLILTTKVPALMAQADPARIEQVLGYLLDNAIKFGQESGPVEVTVERGPARRRPAEQHARQAQASDIALISIRDYGLGLPAEEHSKLFTPFYRGPEHSTHRRLAGLGLGLYLSHYLVTRQNGLLWAEFPDAAHFGGSIFYLSLPIAPS